MVLLVAIVAGSANNRVTRKAVFILGGLGLTRKLDVVVRELANFDVVNTENFLFLSCAKPESRNPGTQETENGKDDTGTAEGVGAASHGVRNLVAKLDPVVVDPTTVNLRGTIKGSNVVTARPLTSRDLMDINKGMGLTQRRTQ